MDEDVLKYMVKTGIREEYGFDCDINVNIMDDFHGNKAIDVFLLYNGYMLRKNMNVSWEFLKDSMRMLDNEIVFKDIVLNLVHSFKELKIIKSIGNDHNKAILNTRHKSYLVREYCRGVINKVRVNEVS